MKSVSVSYGTRLTLRVPASVFRFVVVTIFFFLFSLERNKKKCGECDRDRVREKIVKNASICRFSWL